MRRQVVRVADAQEIVRAPVDHLDGVILTEAAVQRGGGFGGKVNFGWSEG